MATLPSFLKIDAADAPRVVWLFVHSLCVGIYVSFLFCAGNALFLSHFDARILPWGYLASGLFGTLVVKIFARLAGRLSFPRLLLAQIGFLFLFLLGLFAAGLLLPDTSRKFVAFTLFIFTGPSIVVINLEFWSLTQRLFNVRQSKRFNPLVASGEALASIAGYFFVPLLSPKETLFLLLPALAGLAGSAAIVVCLSRLFANELPDRQQEPVALGSAADEAPRDRYFVLMATVAGLVVAAYYLVDFTFLSELKNHYSSPEQVAAFIGVFYGAVKVCDLLLKTLVSGRLVQLFGLRLALRVLPVALLASVMLTWLFGAESSVFIFVALTKFLWPVLRKSVFDPAFKVLYQPLPEEESLALQSRIDGGVRQIGTLLAGIALLLLSGDAVGNRAFLAGLVLVLVLWIVFIGPLYKEYRRRLADSLSHRQAPPMVQSSVSDLRRWLSRLGDREGRAAIATLTEIDPVLEAAISGRLGAKKLADLEEKAELRLETSSGRRLFALYEASEDSLTVPWLVEKLGFPQSEIRLAAIESLVARGYRADAEVAARLRNGIERLASDMTWNLAALADFRHGLREQPSLEKVRHALHQEIGEQRRQVFLHLALLFDADAVGLAREGLKPGLDEGESKANALELLETLVSDEIRPLVLTLVEELPEATALKRLQRIFPSEPVGWRERLSAMLQRSRSQLSLDVQVVALEVLADSCQDGEVAAPLAASLFHPDPMLQEVAARAIAHLDPEECRRRLAKLPVETHRWLESVISADSPGPPATIYERVQLLDSIELLAALPRTVKQAMAANLVASSP